MKFATSMMILVCLAGPVAGQTISTSFSQADGFTTGSTTDVVLGDATFSATFSGGQQEQSFDGPSYNSGPEAYFFINGNFTGSFGRSVADSTDMGTVDFSVGVTELSFYAADRANGTPSFRILGLDDQVLDTALITGTSNRASDGAIPFSFSSSDLGALIGGIEFDNAGPAGRPPYVIAIDSFSATAVPEPTTMAIGLLATLGAISVRRAVR